MCVLILAGILFVGLWPFNFFEHNNVTWLKDTNGISFGPYGIAYTQVPLDIRQSFPQRQITIQAVIRPEDESENGINRIVSFCSADNFRETFFIGQWRSHLIVRVWNHPLKPDNSFKEMGKQYALQTNSLLFLTITSSPEQGTVIYMNGTITAQRKEMFLLSDTVVQSVRMFLGNSAKGEAPWNGSILSLALFNNVQSSQKVIANYALWKQQNSVLSDSSSRAYYAFDEKSGLYAKDNSANGRTLCIPRIFSKIHKSMDFKPANGLGKNRTDKIDIFVNILGFIPLGFFLALYFSQMKRGSLRTIYGYTLFTGFLMGLCIEVLQMYLPTRNSSCVDLCMNTLGAFIGIALLHFSFQFEGPVFHKNRNG